MWECFCVTLEDNPGFMNHIWLCDEAHFLLSGHVNSTHIYLGTSASEELSQSSLHPKKCTAWVAISKHGPIRPYWLEDENERTQTVNI